MQVKLTPTLIKDMTAVRDFGYRDEREFIYDAIKRRLFVLKKATFMQSVQRVRRALRRSGLTEESILKDFTRYSRRK